MDPKKSNEELPDDLSNLDAEEAQLRDEAQQTDPVRPEDADIEDDVHQKTKRAQAERPEESTSPKKPAADDKKAEVKPSKETAPEKAKDAKAEEKPEDESKLSPYERDRRRLNRNRQEFEQEKANERQKLAAERAALENERKQLQAARQPKTAEKPKHNGYTAEQYDDVAKDFRAEGKIQEAEYAEARAKELREAEAKQPKDTAAQEEFITLQTGARITAAEQKQMEAEWAANLKRLGEQNPELMKEGTPLRTAVAELLKPGAYPILHTHASGIHYAVEVAKLKVAAAQVPDLQKRITELETENERLTGLTSLPPTGAGGQHREKPKPTDMANIDEAEEALREEAMMADARH